MSHTDETRTSLGLAEQFAALWNASDTMPDVFGFLAYHSDATPRDQADILLIDQSKCWQRGEPRLLNEYFANCPDIAADRDLKVELIREEFGYLEESEQTLDFEGVANRSEFGEAWWPYLAYEPLGQESSG